MAIMLMFTIVGIGLNFVMLSQFTGNLPRFAKTCKGCGCQTPPMEYPPAVYECPVCQWMAQRSQQYSLGLRHKHPDL